MKTLTFCSALLLLFTVHSALAAPGTGGFYSGIPGNVVAINPKTGKAYPNPPPSPECPTDRCLHYDIQWEQEMWAGDYHDALHTAQKIEKIAALWPHEWSERFAQTYAAEGKPQQALQVFHAYFYAYYVDQNGSHYRRGLFWDNLDEDAYCTYSLLELQAGNWKEAAYAFDLAGAYDATASIENTLEQKLPLIKRPSRSYVVKQLMLMKKKVTNKVYSTGGPGLSVLFSLDHPQPALLRAACDIALGANLTQDITFALLNKTISGNHLYDRVDSLLSDAVAQAPNSKTAWYYYGKVLWRAGHYQAALSALHHAQSLNSPQDPKFAHFVNCGIRNIKYAISTHQAMPGPADYFSN